MKLISRRTSRKFFLSKILISAKKGGISRRRKLISQE
jgi:hypothetical protein